MIENSGNISIRSRCILVTWTPNKGELQDTEVSEKILNSLVTVDGILIGSKVKFKNGESYRYPHPITVKEFLDTMTQHEKYLRRQGKSMIDRSGKACDPHQADFGGVDINTQTGEINPYWIACDI